MEASGNCVGAVGAEEGGRREGPHRRVLKSSDGFFFKGVCQKVSVHNSACGRCFLFNAAKASDHDKSAACLNGSVLTELLLDEFLRDNHPAS